MWEVLVNGRIDSTFRTKREANGHADYLRLVYKGWSSFIVSVRRTVY